MRNEHGVGLLLAVMLMLGLLVAFLQLTTFVSENMTRQTSATKRQLAGHMAMQDFAQLAQKAYQTYTSNGNSCPAGTTRLPATKPFCWANATADNPHCIVHPMAGPTSAATRMICLNSATPETMEVISKNDHWPWWKKLLFSYKMTAEAQVREAHMPDLTGAPTVSYAAAPNCTSSFNSTYCKMCATVGAQTQNLNCVYLRVCLKNTACSTTDNSDWTIQRIGVQIF